MNFYLVHHFDDSLSIAKSESPNMHAAAGPYGSYYSLLSRFMDFTPRPDRNPIRCSTQDEVLECVDAVTRLVCRKLNVYSCADAWFADQWGIRLGTSAEMTVITFLYAGDTDELLSALKEEGYLVDGSSA